MNKKLVDYGGQGFRFSKENGKFEVKATSTIKIFTKLSEARNYYDSLNEEKAIWDITGMPELLDCQVFEK